jgi:hypothetical protein
MKTRWLLSLILFVAIVSSACQFGTPASTEYPAPVQDAPPTDQEYPYPAQDVPLPGMEYPYPLQGADIPPPPAVLYPDIKDGDEIYWNWVELMMWNGEVAKIVQSPELKIFVTLKDGRTFFSWQPEAGYVLKTIEGCGDICKDILVETE